MTMLHKSRYVLLILALIDSCLCIIDLARNMGVMEEEIVDIFDVNTIRHKRDTDLFKQTMIFNITTKNRNITLTLRMRNTPISVPMYTTINDEIVRYKTKVNKAVKFYTDRHYHASIGVECETNQYLGCKYLLTGNLFLDGTHHVIQPRSVRGRHYHHVLVRTAQAMNFKSDYMVPNHTHTRPEMISKQLNAPQAIETKSIAHYKVELLIICDYSVYQFWYNKNTGSTPAERDENTMNSIMEYYAYVINDINVHYESIVNRGLSWDLEIVYSSIYVAKTAAVATWIENDKEWRSGENWIKGATMLTNLQTWLTANSVYLPHYDHAFGFTAYEVYSDNYDANQLGVSWIEGICWRLSNEYWEHSVMEDRGASIIGVLAAHELAHNLGALHDGEENACSADDAYVMTPNMYARYDDKANNHYIFSQCSIHFFWVHMNYLNANNWNCLATTSPTSEASAMDSYTLNNGQVYTVDQQCKQNENGSSYFCRYWHYEDPTTICSYLSCVNHEYPDYCRVYIPWEGTTCGDKMWCIAGQCVADDRAKSADPTCIWGDEPYCENLITNSPKECYKEHYNVYRCCSICQDYHTGIQGCEYGDRNSTCSVADCTSENNTKIWCCQTCASQTASKGPDTTTSQTTSSRPDTTTIQTTYKVPDTVTSKGPDTTTIGTSPKGQVQTIINLPDQTNNKGQEQTSVKGSTSDKVTTGAQTTETTWFETVAQTTTENTVFDTVDQTKTETTWLDTVEQTSMKTSWLETVEQTTTETTWLETVEQTTTGTTWLDTVEQTTTETTWLDTVEQTSMTTHDHDLSNGQSGNLPDNAQYATGDDQTGRNITKQNMVLIASVLLGVSVLVATLVVVGIYMLKKRPPGAKVRPLAYERGVTGLSKRIAYP